jgi:hypothetical protein
MASCLLAGSRRAEHIFLRPVYASWASSSNIYSHWGANTLRQNATPQSGLREISTSASRKDYHFDTHQFVARLEREGLTRAQAEGVMNSMAEVIDESIRTMTRNMVTKSEQEKVSDALGSRVACHTQRPLHEQELTILVRELGCLYSESRLWTVEDGTATHGTKRPGHAEGGERQADGRFGEVKAKIKGRNNENSGGSTVGSEFGKG